MVGAENISFRNTLNLIIESHPSMFWHQIWWYDAPKLYRTIKN
jgi:hypothetical protein